MAKRKRKVGRPSKFTPKVREKILDALYNGAFLSTAAAYARINPWTLNNWLNKGKDAQELLNEHEESVIQAAFEGKEPPEAPVLSQLQLDFVQFSHDVDEALSNAELSLLQQVDDPRWILKVRWKEKYGGVDRQPIPIALSNDGDKPLQTTETTAAAWFETQQKLLNQAAETVEIFTGEDANGDGAGSAE